MSAQLRRQPWLIVVPLFLFVMTVGAFQLDGDGLWYDEWWSLLNAGGAPFFDAPLSPVQVVERLAADDPFQTPGYPLILSAWVALTGGTAYAGRVLSLLSALLGLALTYRAALAFTRDIRAAQGAALLFSGSAWLIYFAHELRGYTLLLVFCLLFVYSYWRAATFRGRLDYLLVAGSGIVALNLHAFAFPVYVSLGIWHLSRLVRRDVRGWGAASFALLVPGLALLPWAALLVGLAGTLRDVERVPVTASLLIEIVGRVATAFSSMSPMLLVLLALFSLRQRGSLLVWGLALGILLHSLALFALARIGEPRYAIAVLPFLAILAGMGAAQIDRRGISLGVTFALWSIPMLLTLRDPGLVRLMQNTYPQPNREIAQTLLPYLTADVEIVNYLGAELDPIQQQLPLFQYLGREDVRFVDIDTTRTLDRFVARFDEAVAGVERMWLVSSPLFARDEVALVKHLLFERGFAHCLHLADDETMDIAAYARLGAHPPSLRYSEEAALSLLGIGQTRQYLLLWVEIEAIAAPDAYSLGIQLMQSDGVLVAQQDIGLPSPGVGCRLFALSVAGLAPGSYNVSVVVYDWRTGVRLPGVSSDGQEGDLLPLTTVRLDG